ncbi:MAG: 2-C-methyl-D-erythritol 4-phosphate cytidylyltransferase [Elusimicrobia bacterium]|nr:2-C-methyl-D-erythritol 4-phosphate cytidylyltransferase [Elusimicrobiota bacterium]
MRDKLQFCSAVIVAAGKSKRMGRDKQMLSINGRPMLFYSVEAFKKVPSVKEIIVVTSRKNIAKGAKYWKENNVRAILGRETRLLSVKRGVRAVSKKAQVVAVHDGARPLAEPKLISLCIEKAFLGGAAVLAVPLKDTIKKVSSNGAVEHTPKRKNFYLAQTPQCYRMEIIKRAMTRFSKEKRATDESQLVEKMGVRVLAVKSSYANIKVTTPEDLIMARALMDDRNCGSVRVGFGYDIHRMVQGRPLIMGGVNIAHDKGLLGHSDGDVILHAVCDAALGAVAAGEIGMYFPPTDLTIMGISSRVIVEKTLSAVKEKKAQISQIDLTVIAEEPKLSGHYQIIRKSLAELFGLALDNVSVKAKSQEGLGEIGRGEAIACHAVVMVRTI